MAGVNPAMTVVVRYFAAARAAAGADEEKLQVGGAATVADLLGAIRAEHGDELSRVLDRCSFLLDEVAVRDLATPLTDAATVDVLPPFAGG
jgi:molybdopterin synthase sulfur carrier subunit